MPITGSSNKPSLLFFEVAIGSNGSNARLLPICVAAVTNELNDSDDHTLIGCLDD